MEEIQKTKTVRLEGEVLDSLANERKGFETPSDCIKRIIQQRSCKPKTTPQEK